MEKRAILLAVILAFVLAGGCLEEIKNKSAEDIHDNSIYNSSLPDFETEYGHLYESPTNIYNYSTPGFEINQTQAFAVWEIVKFSDGARFVTLGKSYSVIVFIHPYKVAPFDPMSAEWIALVASLPEKREEIKIAIFRLDYQTFKIKRFYTFSYPAIKELDLQQSSAVMEEEMKKESYGPKSVENEKVSLLGGNYIYSYPASRFGGTMILNKYAGRIIFYATTIWGEDGRLINPGEEVNGTKLFPEIDSFVLSSVPPAYRGTSTSVTLLIRTGSTGISIPNGTEILLDYKVELLHPDGILESEPEGIEVVPEQKKFVFPGNVKSWEINQIEPKFKINISPSAAEGDYFITLTWKFRGLVVGRNVLTFKIGKGWRLSQYRGWNIGYSSEQSPLLNETEKAEAAAIAVNDPYLKDRKYDIIKIKSEFHELENFSGFFPVVRIDVGEPRSIGEIVSYIVDLEEKKVMNRTASPREPAEYFTGEAFDEARGNLTKRWDAWNFPGLWLDTETNTSTETLVIDQNILDSSIRVIEKHNLAYTTYSIPYKFQVFANVNVTSVAISNAPFEHRTIDYASIPSEEKKETYQAIGWQGEKHAFIEVNRVVKVLLEQNASEVKTLAIGESWNMSDGYVLTANSIDAKATTPQAWFTLTKDGTKLYDIVMLPRRLWIYTQKNDTVPLFITYFNKISQGPYMDEADFKYTWLRSQDITEIKEGDTFGIMEVTSIGNGAIELRNKEPIDLSPGKVVNLMGSINIQVENSSNSLSFHPFRVIKPWS